jgi:transketolase
MKNRIRLVGVGAGLTYGPAGATHHAIEDIAIMRVLPGMMVCCPGDPYEVEKLINQSIEHDGPIYFRLGKNNEKIIHNHEDKIEIGKISIVLNGQDEVVLTTSNTLEMAVSWANEQKQKLGKSIMVASVHTIKPLDKDFIVTLISKNIPITTIEEHNIIGGLGSAVAEIIAELGHSVKFKRIGIPDVFTHKVGGQEYLRKELGIKL